MSNFEAETIEAMLLEVTEKEDAVDSQSVASYDELERIGRASMVAGTTTEPCVKTCGGCRG